MRNTIVVKPVSTHHRTNRRRVTTTVGELLAAAYDATGGQVGRTLKLLDEGPLHSYLERRLVFV